MILCVEDDDAIRELEVYALRGAGFEAQGCADAAAFWDALTRGMPELVILDVMLPDEDGITLLRRLRLRADTRALPVLMASAKGAEYDKVLGLDTGADDYIAKPFGMTELAARVRALLRRATCAPQAAQDLCVGGIVLSPAHRRVLAAGAEVSLTRKEFDLLAMLMRRPGVVCARDQLLLAVWGYDFDGETRTLDVHMRTLRQKLGSAGAQLETVRGVGYRIAAAPEQE